MNWLVAGRGDNKEFQSLASQGVELERYVLVQPSLPPLVIRKFQKTKNLQI
jgi:hypothetical protein